MQEKDVQVVKLCPQMASEADSFGVAFLARLRFCRTKSVHLRRKRSSFSPLSRGEKLHFRYAEVYGQNLKTIFYFHYVSFE